MSTSMILNQFDGPVDKELDSDVSKLQINAEENESQDRPILSKIKTDGGPEERQEAISKLNITPPRKTHVRQASFPSPRRTATMPSPLRSSHQESSTSSTQSPLVNAHTRDKETSTDEVGEFTDEPAREVTHGRLVHGHIVPDDYPSPSQSAMSNSMILDNPDEDPMSMSHASSFFAPDALGGTADATATSDEEEENLSNPKIEQMITLVGDVRNRTVFMVDDMIDKSGSWIAAAETVVKRGGANKVYIIATHGLFGGDSLEDLEDCDCIDKIIVTNSFPIPKEKIRDSRKLIILDLSVLLSEAIRRNHYGESISALFSHSND